MQAGERRQAVNTGEPARVTYFSTKRIQAGSCTSAVAVPLNGVELTAPPSPPPLPQADNPTTPTQAIAIIHTIDCFMASIPFLCCGRGHLSLVFLSDASTFRYALHLITCS